MKTWENAFIPIGIDKEKIHYDWMLWHIFISLLQIGNVRYQAITVWRNLYD